jgi:Protein of unknown function (DUF3309)
VRILSSLLEHLCVPKVCDAGSREVIKIEQTRPRSVIVLLGGFSGFGGGPFYGTGYYGGGGLGLILIIVLILVLLGRL